VLTGHVNNALWGGFTPNGKMFISAGQEDCILWNVSDWSKVFHAEEKVDLIFSARKKFVAIRHDDKIKMWSDIVI
jgi:hypothetical protein